MEDRQHGTEDRHGSGHGGGSGSGAVRVRSSHHRHRHGASAFRGESGAEARRSQDMKIIFWIVPWSVLVAGLLLLFFSTRQPYPEMRPRGLVSLSQELIAGGTLLVLCAHAFAWWKGARERAERRMRDSAGRGGSSGRRARH